MPPRRQWSLDEELELENMDTDVGRYNNTWLARVKP